MIGMVLFPLPPDYFMSLAFLSAKRSKDPSTQVGAAIVSAENKIVGIGYNGFPIGCSDDTLPWARKADSKLDTKYPYVVHAEVNAILNKNAASAKGSRCYVTLFPCNECAKIIIQSGISEVVYFSDKYHDSDASRASRRLLELAGVATRQHVPAMDSLTINFAPNTVHSQRETSMTPPPGAHAPHASRCAGGHAHGGGAGAGAGATD